MTEQKNKNSASSKDKSARENEERLNNLQMEISDKNEEISSLRARESQNEEYSSRLARKLDRIMAENHNRTQKELRKLLKFDLIIILFIVIKKIFVTLVYLVLLLFFYKINISGDRMQLLEEKNRLGMENTSLRRQLDDLNARIKTFEFSMQNQYGPPIMTNGEQVRFLFRKKLDLKPKK